MPRERNAFKLGLTLIVALGLFIALIFFIGETQFEPRVPIVVRIGHDQNTPRLKKGAPVICGPVQVGSVESVSLIEAPKQGASGPGNFLYFEIRAEVNRSLGLKTDCLIVVEGPLLGDNGQLRVADRGMAPHPVSTREPIYATPSGFASDFAMITGEFDAANPKSLLSQVKAQLDPKLPQSLVAKFHKSVEDVNEMTTNLRRTVDPSRDDALVNKVDSILTHLNILTASLRAEAESGHEKTLMAKVHRGLDDLDLAIVALGAVINENREGVRGTVRGVESMANRLDQKILPAVEAELDRTKAESLLTQAHVAFDEMNRALADLEVVTGKVRRVTTLGEDRVLTFIDNAAQASDHLKAVAKDLRRNPWRLIHKPDDVESKQAYVFDAVREFTEAASDLDDSAARFNALMEAENGHIPETDPTLINIREKLADTMKRFTAAEEALWKQLDVK